MPTLKKGEMSQISNVTLSLKETEKAQTKLKLERGNNKN